MTEVIHHRVSHIDYDDDEPDPHDILGEPEVRLETTFENVVVVDHIPVTSEDRFQKLSSVLKNVFGQMGTIAEDGLYIPVDEETKSTKGFAFVEYTTKEAAEQAVKQLHGFRLDKSHVFNVVRFDDFKKVENVPDEYVEVPLPKIEPKDNLQSWLLDDRTVKGTDQFVVRQGDTTDIYWNDAHAQKPDLDESRLMWTDTYVMWSPMGTYMATFHRQGIQLWGGPKWTKQMRFNHPQARLIDFSPCEKYLVTFSPQFAENDDPKDPKCIIIWDVRTGAKMRGFTGSDTPQWPKLLWSHDDKFFARLGEDAISVYETPSMGLLDKQSIKIPGVKDFAWSPKQNTISYFVPESGNTPAKVVLISLPTRKELRQKNLFNVKDCKLHWHAEGKFLCVKVDRHTKTKKSTFVNFELFRVKEKDIPIELMEVKDQVHAFAWEPKGDRFAIIHGDNANRPDVSFYSLAGKQLAKLRTIEKRPANALFWSPAGDMIILAGLRNLNGVLEFFSVNEMETVANEEHNMCMAVDWDPSGRFVATSVSHWRHQIDTGYNIYTFDGKLLYKVVKDKFFQLLWRPRPPTLLSPEKLKQISDNLGSYEKRYNDEEKEALRRERDAKRRIRDAARRTFNKLVEEREREYAAWRPHLNVLYERDLEEDEKKIEEVDEIVEELINVEEIVEE